MAAARSVDTVTLHSYWCLVCCTVSNFCYNINGKIWQQNHASRTRREAPLSSCVILFYHSAGSRHGVAASRSYRVFWTLCFTTRILTIMQMQCKCCKYKNCARLWGDCHIVFGSFRDPFVCSAAFSHVRTMRSRMVPSGMALRQFQASKCDRPVRSSPFALSSSSPTRSWAWAEAWPAKMKSKYYSTK